MNEDNSFLLTDYDCDDSDVIIRCGKWMIFTLGELFKPSFKWKYPREILWYQSMLIKNIMSQVLADLRQTLRQTTSEQKQSLSDLSTVLPGPKYNLKETVSQLFEIRCGLTDQFHLCLL